MRKRKKRRSFKVPANTVWFLLGANIIAGIMFSPLTSARQVRVTGAPTEDHQRVSAFLSTLRGRPALSSSGWDIEAMALKNPAIKSARFQQNLFARASLELIYRQPIATVNRQPGLYLDIEGDLFRSSNTYKNLPDLMLHRVIEQPVLAVSAAWRKRDIAQLCADISQVPALQGWTLHLNSAGSVSAQDRSGSKIEFGDFDQISTKLDLLKSKLSEDSNFLKRTRMINLSSPNNPVFIPKGVER